MNNINYTFHNQFIFRVPRLPLDTAKLDLTSLFRISQEVFFKEAIFLASPVLHDELTKWHKGLLTSEKEIAKLTISLGKYYSRMQSRCTPYGLFAACGTGQWSDKTNIILHRRAIRHTRLDMNFLCALAQKLSEHPLLFPLLHFYPNNSLYILGGKLRYVEYKYENNHRVHQISSVDHSDYLQRIIDCAQKGAILKELTEALTDEDISKEEAEEFILELIGSQILVTELEPAVTGEEFIFQLIASLQNREQAHPREEIKEIIQLLNKVQEQIWAMDTGFTNDTGAYKRIASALKTLNTPIEENQLFQTDLYAQTEVCTLGTGYQRELEKAFRFLNALNPPEEHTRLKKFTENFRLVYEDTEVPLQEALDTETGVGYAGKDLHGVNPLIDDVYIPGKQHDGELKWTRLQNLLHRKLISASANHDYTVSFTDDDVKDINPGTDQLPDTMAIQFRVVDKSGKIFFQHSGGSSAANLLGRFAHGDESILSIIKDITNHEQKLNPGKLLAEIVHLPESRLGNILLRPILREYEIPYLGKSALPSANQILVSDLMISVRNGKVQLRSKRLNKIIVPRLSTAHNFSSNALPVYQFLCDLQTQDFGKSHLAFNWGVFHNQFTFLPRAEYQNTVLARASWQFQKNDFQILLDPKPADDMELVTRWRKQWNMPALVVLADGDNELLIDLENKFSVRILIHTIRNRDRIILEEFLWGPSGLPINNPNGQGYTNEFIAILHKTVPVEKDTNPAIVAYPQAALASASANVQRHFTIGSEWLYYKLYCGIKTADGLLANTLKPLVEKLLERKFIAKFFFIRYQDPHHHLRIRFLLNHPKDIGSVIAIISSYFEPYMKQGLIQRIQTDTYSRELERYGPDCIKQAESFFFTDSMATLNLLDLTAGEAGEQIRWQFALRSIDELLDTFQYKTPDKLGILEQLKTSFTQEHSTGKDLKIQLDNKFRMVRKEVEDILDRSKDEGREITPLIGLLRWKAEQLQPIAASLMRLKTEDKLSVPIDNLLISYIHMMLNRIFIARQRTYEMVLYDLLFRYYKSAEGRQKKAASIPVSDLT